MGFRARLVTSRLIGHISPLTSLHHLGGSLIRIADIAFCHMENWGLSNPLFLFKNIYSNLITRLV